MRVLVRAQIVHVFVSVCFSNSDLRHPLTFAAADLATLISAQPTREVTPDWKMPLLASTTACRTGVAVSTAAAAPACTTSHALALALRPGEEARHLHRQQVSGDDSLASPEQQQRHGNRIDLYELNCHQSASGERQQPDCVTPSRHGDPVPVSRYVFASGRACTCCF